MSTFTPTQSIILEVVELKALFGFSKKDLCHRAKNEEEEKNCKKQKKEERKYK